MGADDPRDHRDIIGRTESEFRKMKAFVQKISAKVLRNPLRKMPRKVRLGFSLPEMTLVLIVSAMVMQTGIEVATAHTKRQITQQTAATMSRVSDDIESYLMKNYSDIYAELMAAPNNVVERSIADMITGNLLSIDAIPALPDRGTPRLFLTLRGDTVYSVLMSFDGDLDAYSPRPDQLTRFAGRVRLDTPNRLSGWDFSLDVPEIAALSGASLDGNLGIIRYVGRDVNVDPYLHRIAIAGRPELNQMEAALDMNGYDITNGQNITTQRFNVLDEMAVNGRIQAAQVTSTGDATIADVSATNITANEVNATNATLTGRIQARNVVADNVTATTMTANDANIDDFSTSVLNGGEVHLATGNYVSINATEVVAEQVITDQIFIGD